MALILLFKLDDVTYGLEIEDIQEVIEHPRLHFAPQAEGVLKGAINFHGQILAVIDLPELLGFNSAERDHRHVVLTVDQKAMVLVVSKVEKIVQLNMSMLDPAPLDKADKAILGTADYEDTVVNLLDTNNIIEKLEQRFAQ